MGVKEIKERIEFIKSYQNTKNNPIISKSYQNEIDTLKKVLDFYQDNGQDLDKVKEFINEKIELINKIREKKARGIADR